MSCPCVYKIVGAQTDVDRNSEKEREETEKRIRTSRFASNEKQNVLSDR